MAQRVPIALVAALVLCTSCGEIGTDDPMAIKRFTLRGEVTLLIPAMQRIVVRHEAIEGWSAATNMEYPIAEAAEMAELSVGDQIRAVVFVQSTRYWLGEIEVIMPAPKAQK